MLSRAARRLSAQLPRFSDWELSFYKQEIREALGTLRRVPQDIRLAAELREAQMLLAVESHTRARSELRRHRL